MLGWCYGETQGEELGGWITHTIMVTQFVTNANNGST